MSAARAQVRATFARRDCRAQVTFLTEPSNSRDNADISPEQRHAYILTATITMQTGLSVTNLSVRYICNNTSLPFLSRKLQTAT